MALRIAFSSSRTSFLDGVAGPFDLIVANPPVHPSRCTRPRSSPDVRDHEPAVALFGRGDDGLDEVRSAADGRPRRGWRRTDG